MKDGKKLELTGLIRRDGFELVLALAEGGYWYLDVPLRAYDMLGERVSVTGFRVGFNRLHVEKISVL